MSGAGMSGLYILDEHGEPVECNDLMEWAKAFKVAESWRIGDVSADGVRVSTAFLGLDHSFGRGEPLLFETVVFGGCHDQEMWRYSTRAEAIAGHAKAVADVLGKME